MDDNRKLAEEVWYKLIKIFQQKTHDEGIAYLSTVLTMNRKTEIRKKMKGMGNNA